MWIPKVSISYKSITWYQRNCIILLYSEIRYIFLSVDWISYNIYHHIPLTTCYITTIQYVTSRCKNLINRLENLAIMHIEIFFTQIKIVRTFFYVETHCCVKNAKEFLIALIKRVPPRMENFRNFLQLALYKRNKTRDFLRIRRIQR